MSPSHRPTTEFRVVEELTWQDYIDDDWGSSLDGPPVGAEWNYGIRRDRPLYSTSPIGVIQPSILTDETCFRRPDGEIVTVLTASIWADEARAKGYVEIPCDSETISLPEISVRERLPDPVVPPGVQGPVFEPPPEVQDDDVSIFESGVSIFGDLVDIWQGATQPAPQIYSGVPYAPLTIGAPAVAPDYSAVTNTGVPSGMYIDKHGHLCHRRRRRRRLLTESDFNDLMRIATLPNKQNVAVALAKAIGRR